MHAFQSHNGAIAAKTGLTKMSPHYGFNPTMVRLLPVVGIRVIGSVVFQSHNGAIAAISEHRCWRRCSGFNPTMVRLLLVRTFKGAPIEISFNPTMVRLLPCLPRWIREKDERFQSHNGAIAAFQPTFSDEQVHGFNPTMVRLLLKVAVLGAREVIVSIPQWCDCCS